MRAVWVSTLEELRPDWDRLAPKNPMLTVEWLSTWWRYYGRCETGAKLCVIGVFDEQDELVGLAPWYQTNCRFRGTTIRFLGSGDVCSDYLTILTRPGREAQVSQTLADWLGFGPLDWNLLDLSDVDATDSGMRHFVGAMAERNAVTHVRTTHNCWRLDLPATWEDYLAQLSKSHRKRCRRFQKTILDSNQAQLRIVTDDESFDRAFAVLVDLHNRRWRHAGLPGKFEKPQFRRFHQEAARLLLKVGKLRMGWLELNGVPVAAEYHMSADSIVYAYQSGMNPDHLADQPGTLSVLATLRQSHQDGCRSMDFMRGDEPYKAHWRAQPRPCVHIRVAPPTHSARLRHGVWYACHQAKSWVKGEGLVESGEIFRGPA